MTTTYKLVTATEQDIPRINDIQFSAFSDDPYQEALHPGDPNDPAVRASANERLTQHWDTDSTARWLLCRTPDDATTVGFALYNIYDTERPESEWRKPLQVDWCTGRKREIAINFLSMNKRLREEIWGGKPYVLLNLLCIHEDFQRRGAGTALVNWGIARAQELRLAVHLEASPAGFHLYSKLGFREVKRVVIKAEEWDGDHDRTYIAMIRDPQV